MSVERDVAKLTVQQMRKAKRIATLYNDVQEIRDAIDFINQGADELTLKMSAESTVKLVLTALQGVVDTLTDELTDEINN